MSYHDAYAEIVALFNKESVDNDYSNNLKLINDKFYSLLSENILQPEELNQLTQLFTQHAQRLVNHAKSHPDDVEEITFSLMGWLIALGSFKQEGIFEIKQGINDLSELWSAEKCKKTWSRLPYDFLKKFKMSEDLEPKNSDSAIYNTLFYHLKELQYCHLLGHHFGLRGERYLFGGSIKYQLAHPSMMQDMLKSSYGAFHQANEAPLDALQSVFKNAKPDAIKAVLDNIYQDVMNVNKIDRGAEQALENNHTISITISSLLGPNDGHLTCMVASQDFLIYGDRYPTRYNGSGLEIMSFDEKTELSGTIATLRRLSNKGIDGPWIESDFLEKTKAELNLKTTHMINLSPQKSDTCGWASSAKMVVHANAFLHFYQLAKNSGMSQAMSLQKAEQAARILYDAWAKDFDRIYALNEYIAYHQSIPAEFEIPPDKKLLGMILLQSDQKSQSYRQNITKKIQGTGWIDEEAKKEAYVQLDKNIQETLKSDKMEYYEKVKGISFNTLKSEKEDIKEVFDSERYTQTYLKSGTKQADSELEERVQDTIRRRFLNKDKRDIEMRLHDLRETLRLWNYPGKEVKFSDIENKCEELFQKGVILPPSKVANLTQFLLVLYSSYGTRDDKVAAEFDKCLSFFLEKGGVDANAIVKNEPLIHLVRTEGALQCFLKKGGDINQKNANGETLLMDYVQRRNFKGVEFLLRNGADLSIMDNQGHDAMYYCSSEDIKKQLEESMPKSRPRM